MRNADVREFIDRPRAEVAAAKREYWAELHRTRGPSATVEASHALWRHMRRLRPDWPTAQERAADLAHHVELKRKIDAARHAWPR